MADTPQQQRVNESTVLLREYFEEEAQRRVYMGEDVDAEQWSKPYLDAVAVLAAYAMHTVRS